MKNTLLSRSVLKRFSNLRYKLLALLLVPLLLLTGTVVLLASKWSSDYTYEQLFNKVNADLRVAGESFQRIQQDGQQQMSALAGSAEMSELLSQNNSNGLLLLLKKQRLLYGFDFLKLLSIDGSKVLRSQGWAEHTLRQ